MMKAVAETVVELGIFLRSCGHEELFFSPPLLNLHGPVFALSAVVEMLHTLFKNLEQIESNKMNKQRQDIGNCGESSGVSVKSGGDGKIDNGG